MFIQRNGVVAYTKHDRCIILDRITPEILKQRLIDAGYSPVLSSFLAFNGGLNTRVDALMMGKLVGEKKPLFTRDSYTIIEE